MVIENIRHTGFVVSDIEKCKNIFTKVFQLNDWKDFSKLDMAYIRTLVSTDSRKVKICVFSLPDGGKIELLEYSKNTKRKIKADEVGVNHIAFTVKNIDEIFDKRLESNLEFVSSPVFNPEKTVRVAYAKICDDFYVELVEEL
jgi:catechol 2,3-dioxygenase-like lactoylglutathione lyase family enzyme